MPNFVSRNRQKDIRWSRREHWEIEFPYHNPRIPLGGEIYIYNVIKEDRTNVSCILDLSEPTSPYILGGEVFGAFHPLIFPHEERYRYDIVTKLYIGDDKLIIDGIPEFPSNREGKVVLRVIGSARNLNALYFHHIILTSGYWVNEAALDLEPTLCTTYTNFVFILPSEIAANIPPSGYYFTHSFLELDGLVNRRSDVYLLLPSAMYPISSNLGYVGGLRFLFALDITRDTSTSWRRYQWYIKKIEDRASVTNSGDRFNTVGNLILQDTLGLSPSASTPLSIILGVGLNYSLNQLEDTTVYRAQPLSLLVQEQSALTTSATPPAANGQGNVRDMWNLSQVSEALIVGNLVGRTETTYSPQPDTTPLTYRLDVATLFSLPSPKDVVRIGGAANIADISTFSEIGTNTGAEFTLQVTSTNSFTLSGANVPVGLWCTDSVTFSLSDTLTNVAGTGRIYHNFNLDEEDTVRMLLPFNVEHTTTLSLGSVIWELFRNIWVLEASPLYTTDSFQLSPELGIVDVADFQPAGGGKEASIIQPLNIEETSPTTHFSIFHFPLDIYHYTQLSTTGVAVSHIFQHTFFVGELSYTRDLYQTMSLRYNQSIEETSNLQQSTTPSTPLTVLTFVSEHYLVPEENTVKDTTNLVLRDVSEGVRDESMQIVCDYTVDEGMPPHSDSAHLFTWHPPSEEGDEGGAITV